MVKHGPADDAGDQPPAKVPKQEAEEPAPEAAVEQKAAAAGEDSRSRRCPYLDTINRSRLDFDFEKLCSISLSHLNVYACLVCGKYFQGRGKGTHAHTHSMAMGHYVFLNLETHRFYCLPDNYEVIDSSLENIIYLLNPTYSRQQIARIDADVRLVRAHDGNTYLPGVVGLNNLKASDYCNAIIHLLSHVAPVRNFFLREQNYAGIRRPPGDQLVLLVRRFGELVRKLWNPRNFKTHVSPHEFLQAVVLCSKKRFQFTEQGDAVDFMSWLLNSLHLGLNGTKAVNSSIINRTFRGRMRIYSHKVIPVELTEQEKLEVAHTDEYMEKVEESHFLFLTCDLPAPPLYPDEFKENIIPQVPLANILSKFNGVTNKEYKTHKDSTMKRFQIIQLPHYIILYCKRFVKNLFAVEKNPTIVNFPIRGVDFGDLLDPWTRARHEFTTYDLVANVVHDGGREDGSYRLHLLRAGADKWFELQDLHVTEVLPQMIPLSETLVQVWRVDTGVKNPTFGRPPPVPTEPTAVTPGAPLPPMGHDSAGKDADKDAGRDAGKDAEMPPPPPPPPPQAAAKSATITMRKKQR